MVGVAGWGQFSCIEGSADEKYSLHMPYPNIVFSCLKLPKIFCKILRGQFDLFSSRRGWTRAEGIDGSVFIIILYMGNKTI